MTYEWTDERLKYWNKSLKLYDIKPEELNTLRKELLVAQGFKCALLGENLSGRVAFLDHAHNSGEIRGVLCYTCNRFLVAKNTTDTSLAVVRYLSDPPAAKFLDPILDNIRKVRGRVQTLEDRALNGRSDEVQTPFKGVSKAVQTPFKGVSKAVQTPFKGGSNGV